MRGLSHSAALCASRFARRLAHSSRGLALTEFAFALPVLLALGLGGLEISNFAMAHLRVSNIAMMTADNAARVRDNIDEGDLVELFGGAVQTGDSIDFADRGRIILSSIENDGSTQWIRWQRCIGSLDVDPAYGRPKTEDGDAITDGTEIFDDDGAAEADDPSSPADWDQDTIGSADNPISATPNAAVMMVEVTYAYQPIIPSSFLEGRQIRYESSFSVRQRNDQRLRNGNQIDPRSCG